MSNVERLLREKESLDHTDRLTFEQQLRLSEVKAELHKLSNKSTAEYIENPDYERPKGVDPALQEIRDHFKNRGEL